MSVLAEAWHPVAAPASVLPIRADGGTKQALIQWKEFQQRRSTPEEGFFMLSRVSSAERDGERRGKMRRRPAPLDWMVPREVTLDVLVDAEQLAAAVARLEEYQGERGAEDRPRQAVLLADCGQLGVRTAAAEGYCWQQLPARVIRSGQTRISLFPLALMVKLMLPGIVRVFVEGRLLNVIGTAGQSFNWRACVRVEEGALPVESSASAWDQEE